MLCVFYHTHAKKRIATPEHHLLVPERSRPHHQHPGAQGELRHIDRLLVLQAASGTLNVI